jgi:hypothetical protein
MAYSRTGRLFLIGGCVFAIVMMTLLLPHGPTTQTAQIDRPLTPTSAPANCGPERILLDDGVAFGSETNLVKAAELLYDNPQLYAHPTPALAAKLKSWGATPLMNGTRFCVAKKTDHRAELVFVLSGDMAGSYLWIAQSMASTEN